MKLDTDFSSVRNWLKSSLILTVFAGVHSVAVYLGNEFYFEPGHVATMWLGSGLLMGALLVSRTRFWPALVVVATISQMCVDLLIYDKDLVNATLLGINNTFEALVGATLLRRVCGGAPDLGKLRDVLSLLLVGALGATLFSTVGGAYLASIYYPGTDYWSLFQTWWFADALGVLVVTPVILAFAQTPTLPLNYPRWRYLELAALFGGAIAVGWYLFGTNLARTQVVLNQPYIGYPFIIWAVLRFKSRAVTVALSILALIVVSRADMGFGHFIQVGQSTYQLVLSVQSFLAFLTSSSLVIFAFIAERKKAEEQTYRTGLLLEEMGSMAKIGGWELDLVTMEPLFTEETFRIYELPPSSRAPNLKDGMTYFARESWPLVKKVAREAIEESLPFDIEVPFITAKSRNIWVRVKGKVRFEEGEAVRLYGSIQDISKHIEAEKETVRLASVVEQSDDYVLITNTAGNVVYVNPSFERTTGYTSREIMGNNPRMLSSGLHTKEYYENIWQTILSGKPWHGDLTNRNKDGSLIEEQATMFPIFDSNREIINFAAIKRDVTARNQLESQLRQAQKMEAIGTLSGGIAHDFNNILGVILGYAGMAKDDATAGSRYQEYLTKVLSAAIRAKDLVNQILAFSRQSQVDRIAINPAPLVKEGLKMLRSSIPTTIAIKEDINPRCGTILADPTQIHQIIMNLCTNAYQSMEKTGGEINVRLTAVELSPNDIIHLNELSPGKYVRFSVSDNGPGIAPNIVDNIFDPYFTTKESGKGTGLGLAIIRGIAADYGGCITVETGLGKGSTFHVFFPVIQQDSEIVETQAETIPTGTERIFFIDDEKLLAELGKDSLEKLGYSVTIAGDSLQALDIFQSDPNGFDLIITDQTMPDMTGFEMARRMLQIRPDMPIILCTGFSSQVDAQKAKSIGIREFSLKPIVIKDMAKLIREVLDARTN